MTHENAIATLLKETQNAHHEYETNVLKGVRHEAWATWYAYWMFQHDISCLLLTDTTFDELVRWLTEATATYDAETAGKSWARHAAQYIIEQMTGKLIA